MQANNPQTAPGQVNLNQLVRAQHIQSLPNLNQHTKAQWISHIANCQSVLQSQPPGSNEYNQAIRNWQQATQRFHAARIAAAEKGGAGQGGQPVQQNQQVPQNVQQNVPQNMPQNMPQNAPQVNQGQNQMNSIPPQGQPNQAMGLQSYPKQIVDYVNNFTYYHPDGIPPGSQKYEEYRNNVKPKHAKILLDNERNKADVNKLKAQIEQFRAAGQEVPPQIEERRQKLEQSSAQLRQQLTNWSKNQQLAKAKLEANQRGEGGAGQQSQPSNNAPTGGVNQQVNMNNPQLSTSAQQPPTNSANMNRPPPMSPTPTSQSGNISQTPTSFNQPPQHANTSMPQNNNIPQQQRPSISGQHPPINAIQTPQSANQSGNPTPLSHRQAIERAYSDQRTPQSAQINNQNSTNNQSQSFTSGQQTPRETPNAAAAASQSAKLMTSKPISPSFSQPPVAVTSFAQARPTMAGPANGMGGVMGTPAIVKQSFNLESTESGGVLSKKKLDELVRQVTGGGEGMGGEQLTPEVEEAMLLMADEFVDNVITASCKLAKLRDSSALDVRDIQLILERNYNIRIPGYASDELRAIRKFAPAPGWTAKMNAIQAAKVMGGKNDI